MAQRLTSSGDLLFSGGDSFSGSVALVLQGGKGSEVSGISILLVLLLGICLMSRALKSLPIAFIIVAVMGTGLFWLFSYFKQFSFAGDIPTQTIVLVITVLLLAVLGISFFIEKTIDLLLGAFRVGPNCVHCGCSCFPPGLLIGLHITDHHGLLNLLRG